MSSVLVKAALETALNGMSPSLSTAWECVDFAHDSGAIYQRVTVLFAKPENPVFGSDFYREIGFMQVDLFYPKKKGSGDAMARAELIRATFKRGNSFTQSGVTVIVDSTPEISNGYISGDRFVLPVIVNFYANIGT
jgi:hypothetical protein